MPGTGVKSLPPVVFQGVPLGGNVVLTVGFYAVDGTQVGHGTTGSIPNLPPGGNVSGPAITITEDQLPINSSTVYQHKQKTGLDAEGNHMCDLRGTGPSRAQGPTRLRAKPGGIFAALEILHIVLGPGILVIAGSPTIRLPAIPAQRNLISWRIYRA